MHGDRNANVVGSIHRERFTFPLCMERSELIKRYASNKRPKRTLNAHLWHDSDHQISLIVQRWITFFHVVSQEILCWIAGLATNPLSNPGFRDSIKVLHPAVKLGRDGTPSKNKILPHSSGLERAEGAGLGGKHAELASFSGFQFPARSYCVSWCISPRPAHAFCNIRKARSA